MKTTVTGLVLLGVLAMATAALAAGPLAGNYQSTDMGGTVYMGRYTEGWDTGGSALTSGTTQNCGSWDGTTLDTQWKYTCGTQIANSVLITNNVNGSGNGNRTYASTYVGGVFWLSGAGPWANGDPDYPGHFDSYVEYETIQYVNWVPIAAVTNVQSVAHFDNYPQTCMAFSIGNGSRVGTTDLGGVKPASYPAYLDPSCASTRTQGAWWNFTNLTISILGSCETPVEPSTWGEVKARYSH